MEDCTYLWGRAKSEIVAKQRVLATSCRHPRMWSYQNSVKQPPGRHPIHFLHRFWVVKRHSEGGLVEIWLDCSSNPNLAAVPHQLSSTSNESGDFKPCQAEIAAGSRQKASYADACKTGQSERKKFMRLKTVHERASLISYFHHASSS